MKLKSENVSSCPGLDITILNQLPNQSCQNILKVFKYNNNIICWHSDHFHCMYSFKMYFCFIVNSANQCLYSVLTYKKQISQWESCRLVVYFALKFMLGYIYIYIYTHSLKRSDTTGEYIMLHRSYPFFSFPFFSENSMFLFD